MQNNEKILKKIAKCMRMAKSSNSSEAVTALRQAQKLMQKHNISLDDVALSDVGESGVSIGSRSHCNRWVSNLANMVSFAFGTEHFSFRQFNGPTQMIFVGVKPAHEIASYAFEVLHRQLKNERAAYYKNLRGKRVNKIRKADLFALSWIYSAREKVLEFSGNNHEVITKYIETHHSGLTNYTPRAVPLKKQDISHAVSGSLAGKNVTLNHAVNGADGVKAIS